MTILFKLLRLFNKNLPSPYEVDHVLYLLVKTKRRRLLKVTYILDCYASGDSIDEIAKDMGFSIKRIKFIIVGSCKVVNGF